MEKNKKESQERSAELQKQNAEVQQQSMIAAEKEKMKAVQEDLLFKSKLSQEESKEKKQQIFLEKIGALREKGIEPPDSWLKVEEQILQGILMDSFMENKETEMAVDEGIMQSQQEQAAQQQPMQHYIKEG